MAVYKISITEKYVCLSTDMNDGRTAPTPDPNIPGAELHTTNTGDQWIWNGTKWVEDLRLFKAIVDALNEV